MAKLIALYRKPKDPAAFDRHYHSTQVPLAWTIPGLRAYTISKGSVRLPQGESDYHLVATLTFDSLAAIEAALVSPEGQATAADLANFANGGVELIFFDEADTR